MNMYLLRLVLVVAALATSRATFGAEYQVAENLAPESAETAPLSLDAFHEALIKGPVRRVLREQFAEAQPFWRDAALDFGLRMYDFQRDNGIETIADSFAFSL